MRHLLRIDGLRCEFSRCMQTPTMRVCGAASEHALLGKLVCKASPALLAETGGGKNAKIKPPACAQDIPGDRGILAHAGGPFFLPARGHRRQAGGGGWL